MYLIKKIGKRTKQEQIRILRCFQEKNEKIFFPYKLPLLIQMNQKQIEELWCYVNKMDTTNGEFLVS